MIAVGGQLASIDFLRVDANASVASGREAPSVSNAAELLTIDSRLTR